MFKHDLSRRLGDAISLLQLLEAMSKKFAEENSVDPSSSQINLTRNARHSSGTSCVVPWSGIVLTLQNARKLAEEVYYDLRADVHSEMEVARSETESVEGMEDFELGFTGASALANRIRRVPRDSGGYSVREVSETTEDIPLKSGQ